MTIVLLTVRLVTKTATMVFVLGVVTPRAVSLLVNRVTWLFTLLTPALVVRMTLI